MTIVEKSDTKSDDEKPFEISTKGLQYALHKVSVNDVKILVIADSGS